MLLQGPSCAGNGKRLGKRRKTRAIIPVPTITAPLVHTVRSRVKTGGKVFVLAEEQACNRVVPSEYSFRIWKISKNDVLIPMLNFLSRRIN